MFFTKTALAFLALAFSINALPIHEEESLQKRVVQKLITGLRPGTSNKDVALDGNHKTVSYQTGTDITAYNTLAVPDVMTKWKEGTKQMHGPYISRPGEAKMATTWTSMDNPLVLEGK